MTSIQRFIFVDECLPKLLISTYIQPHLSVAEQPVGLHHYRDKFGPNGRWKDPRFIAELARDGRWAVLTGDLGNQGSRLDSMRLACEQHRVTLICVSASLRERGLAVFGPHVALHWKNIMLAASGPRGGQYQIRFETSRNSGTRFEPMTCPQGYKADGCLCVPIHPAPVHDGEPQSLNRHGRPKKGREKKLKS